MHSLVGPGLTRCLIGPGATRNGEHCVHMEQRKKTSTERPRSKPFGPMQAGRPRYAVHVPSPPKVALPPASLSSRAPAWLILRRGGADGPTPGRPAWPLRPSIKIDDGDAPQCTRSSGSHASARARPSPLPSLSFFAYLSSFELIKWRTQVLAQTKTNKIL